MKRIKSFLSRWGFVLGLTIGLGSVVLMAASPYFWTLVVRTYLDVEGKAVVKDSLRVSGNFKVVGTSTFTGSQIISGYADSIFVGKGYNLGLAAFKVQKYDGTTVSTIDTTGLATVVGLTTTGAITATSQTIASGAVTSSGTSTFAKLQVGATATAHRATIDSIAKWGNDSLELYFGSFRAHIALKAN